MIDVSGPARQRTGYLVIAAAMAAIPTFVWASLSIGETEGVFEQIFLGATFGTVLMMAMRAAPRNGAVWALVWGAFCGAWGNAFDALLVQRTGFSFAQIEDGALSVAPASLDWGTAMLVNLGGWLWLGYFLLPIHLVLLFPGGRAPSQVWRRAMWLAGAVMAGNAAVAFVSLGPWVETPYDEIFAGAMLPSVGYANLILLVLVPLSVGNLVARFRRSSGVERLQFRWLTWAVTLLALSLVSGVVLFPLGIDTAASDVQGVISTVGLAGIPISIGIAITRYRLYDLDVVISRTLVFVALVSFITLVYAGLVVGAGSLMGGSSLGWQIAATAFVAVVFEPVRDRVQRWVNRLVFGRRATPYEVLADLTGRLAETEREEGMLDRMALRLAEGTGADQAIVWLDGPAGFEPAACAPDPERPAGPVADLAAIPGTVVPIRHDGVVLGALSVETRRGDTLTPTETRLVEDLAGSAGLFLRRLRLDQQLERKALELEDSRRRLVDAQDVERRRLERELNEGAQQRVVALKVQLAIAEGKARHERSERTAALLAQMTMETQGAIDQIRALANGIYPPLLEAEGLAAAVRALGELAPVDVQMDTDVSRRYPLPLEGAVYFCVSEALTNAVKHGQAPIAISVVDDSGELAFTVADSGPGFDPTTIRRGSGLNNMNDRLDALEGTIIIDTTPLNSVEAMA